MSIRINSEKCVGCKKCSSVCPGSLIEIVSGKAEILYPKDCWGCVACVKECAFSAIEFYLAEDIGGNGTYMQVEKNGKYYDWNFFNKDGKIRSIRVDTTDSNKY
ncbi:MAG: indolepyruvate ferredoxin oxidoreductase subunit alpha [Acutalibacteraceae bacterium]